jgi:4-hydroxy-4-methyl-2-oxoglutarate aldolase
MEPSSQPAEVLHSLQAFSVPTIANALETFQVLPPNDGFCNPAMKCHFPELGTMVGYAVTARITSDQPPSKVRPSVGEHEYWRWVAAQPGPKVVVVQDMDYPPKGAIWGEWNANVHRALGCVGTVTEGGVRDLNGVQGLGFHFFATAVLPSHAYAVWTDYSGPVRVGGLEVQTGDLLVGDRHGVIHIPPQVPLKELVEVAEEIDKLELEIFNLCQSPDFTLDDLEMLDDSVMGRWPDPTRAKERVVRSV